MVDLLRYAVLDKPSAVVHIEIEEPVMQPDDAFWQVAIKEVRVGNYTFDACKESSCPGIIDTSSSYMGVPTRILERLAGNGGICGRTANPDLQFTLMDGTVLTLTDRDYVARDDEQCASLLYPVDAQIIEAAGDMKGVGASNRQGGMDPRGFILGEPLLRKYYTVFDWGAKKIGFGLAATAMEKVAPVTPVAPPQPEVTKAIFLLQKDSTTTKAPFLLEEDDHVEL